MLRTNASIIPLLRYKHQFFKSRNSAFFGLQVLVAEIMWSTVRCDTIATTPKSTMHQNRIGEEAVWKPLEFNPAHCSSVSKKLLVLKTEKQSWFYAAHHCAPRTCNDDALDDLIMLRLSDLDLLTSPLRFRDREFPWNESLRCSTSSKLGSVNCTDETFSALKTNVDFFRI